MDYPFPVLAECCPLCEGAGCAIYRGYYRRGMICPEMEFVGPVVIRTGYCKTQGTRFALIPDFLFPRRRISRLGVERLKEAYGSTQTGRRLRAAIDEWMAGLGDEFYFPVSTAHSYLNPRTAPPP